MITFLYSSLFDSPAQTLVNTVNTVGVMGKGIAKTFKDRYPAMFREYKKLCVNKELDVGNLHLWKNDDHWVLNFPTKTTWRQPSKLSYIEQGLKTFVENYEAMGIVSISFPPLGCGNGNLDWKEVRPLMEDYLNRISIPVYIHSLHVGNDFVPEHKEVDGLPEEFSKFLYDIRASVLKNKGVFFDLKSGQRFFVQPDKEEFKADDEAGETEFIFTEELEKAWICLRDGLFLIDANSSSKSDILLGVLLSSLPYVQSVEVSRSKHDQVDRSLALFLARNKNKFIAAALAGEQGCLSL